MNKPLEIVTALMFIAAWRGVMAMVTFFVARKEKKRSRNPAAKMSSLMPGLQIVTAGKST